MDWKQVLSTVAPTVASALGGPLAGEAVAAIGSLLGISEPTQSKLKDAIESGRLTSEQVFQIKQLELKYKSEEADRGFKYSELEFKDRESARSMMISTRSNTPALLTWIIVVLVLGLEGSLLFGATPIGVNDLVLGRVLGTLDAALMMVLTFWFGTTNASSRKTELLAVQKGDKNA